MVILFLQLLIVSTHFQLGVEVVSEKLWQEWSFKLENSTGCDLPSLQPIAELTLKPQPFKICATKRHAN